MARCPRLELHDDSRTSSPPEVLPAKLGARFEFLTPENPSVQASSSSSLSRVGANREAAVQAQIADVCEEAGLDGLTDDLVMSYQRDDGSYATVTRSVPLEAIVEAPTLRLKPAKSKRGRK